MAGEGFCGDPVLGRRAGRIRRTWGCVGPRAPDERTSCLVQGGDCRPSPCVPLAFSRVAEQGLKQIGATFSAKQVQANPVALLASPCMSKGARCDVCSVLEVAVCGPKRRREGWGYPDGGTDFDKLNVVARSASMAPVERAIDSLAATAASVCDGDAGSTALKADSAASDQGEAMDHEALRAHRRNTLRELLGSPRHRILGTS
jgi:hypothetical protein